MVKRASEPTKTSKNNNISGISKNSFGGSSTNGGININVGLTDGNIDSSNDNSNNNGGDSSNNNSNNGFT